MSGRRKRSDGSRATLRDVALRAGVSTATVSRSMNVPAAVSTPLRERIESAMAALAFVPDQSARSLSSRHSRLIGVLAPALDDPGWAACIAGTEARLAEGGHSVLLALTGGDARREEAALEAMAGRAVEAVVAIGRAPGETARARLRARGIPVVGVDSDDADAIEGGPDAPGVDRHYGWQRAGLSLGQYLVGLGHVRCAWVSAAGAATGRSAAVRAGVTAAFAQAGQPSPVDVILAATTSHAAWLAPAAARPTALICADDALALTVLRALAVPGVAVPGDMSVTGCGDTPAARCAVPPLTTLRWPYEAVGAAIADRVLASLRGEPAPPGPPPAKLVIRRSTGPAARV